MADAICSLTSIPEIPIHGCLKECSEIKMGTTLLMVLAGIANPTPEYSPVNEK
jgi:hypothetical protein